MPRWRQLDERTEPYEDPGEFLIFSKEAKADKRFLKTVGEFTRENNERLNERVNFSSYARRIQSGRILVVGGLGTIRNHRKETINGHKKEVDVQKREMLVKRKPRRLPTKRSRQGDKRKRELRKRRNRRNETKRNHVKRNNRSNTKGTSQISRSCYRSRADELRWRREGKQLLTNRAIWRKGYVEEQHVNKEPGNRLKRYSPDEKEKSPRLSTEKGKWRKDICPSITKYRKRGKPRNGITPSEKGYPTSAKWGGHISGSR